MFFIHDLGNKERISRMNLSKEDEANCTKQAKDKCSVRNQNFKRILKHRKSTAGPVSLRVYTHLCLYVCV